MKSYMSRRTGLYPFLVVFLSAVFAGVVGSVFLNNRFLTNGFVLVLAGILLVFSLISLRRFGLVTIFIAGCLLGLWRGNIYLADVAQYKQFYKQTITLNGIISEDTSFDSAGRQRFKIKHVAINNKNYKGEVWVSASETSAIKRSDQVVLKGALGEGFGGFAASMPRASVLSVTKTSSGDLGLRVRDNFAAHTDKIPEPERSLGLGYLLGIKNSLPENFYTQIKILGLTHIIVASGYNLTILVTFARKLLVRISKYLSTVLASSMIGGFILITGFSPSMSRAGLVAGLSLTAWYYGRKIHPVTLLIISAAITLMIKPSYISGDLGWYLSFLAFFGILVLAPLLHSYFWGNHKKPSALRELIVATVAAQTLTLPLIMYTFGTFSSYSLLANMLILPAIPFCMLAVFGAGMVSILLPFLAGVAALVPYFLIKYCVVVIKNVSTFPGAAGEFSLSALQMVCAYILILLLTIGLMLITKYSYIKDKIIVD